MAAAIDRDVKFTGLVYQARPDRGPTNREFTEDDLYALYDTVRHLPVLYEHGNDPEIGRMPIGTIIDSTVRNRTLQVQGLLFPKAILTPAIYDRLRRELLDNTIPMLSIRWNAPPVNVAYREEDAIADPTKRKVLEISLVKKGYYPEANIIEVAASATPAPVTNLRWNIPSGVLTVDDGATNDSIQASRPVANTPSESTPTMAVEPKNFALFKQLLEMEKVSEAEQQQIFAQPTILASKLYEKLEKFTGLLSDSEKQRNALEAENKTFAAEKKRQHEEFVTSQTAIAEKLASAYPENKRQNILSFATQVLTNPEMKQHHDLVKDALTGFAQFDGQAQTQAAPAPTPGLLGAQPVTEVGIQASATQQAKRAAPETLSDPFRAFLENALLK